ncbi:hypothetical protein AB0383_07105 [Amycolatopsis sp. NPDC051373]|uniref:hypothetical protein n=1 Tax=Amycolatopsis sp. NPDC051373 TaxID=3155801 RepID=UPI00344E1A64
MNIATVSSTYRAIHSRVRVDQLPPAAVGTEFSMYTASIKHIVARVDAFVAAKSVEAA